MVGDSLDVKYLLGASFYFKNISLVTKIILNCKTRGCISSMMFVMSLKMKDCFVSGCWITTDETRLLVLAVTHHALSLVQIPSRDRRILGADWPASVGVGEV